jgi:hypothetical protein
MSLCAYHREYVASGTLQGLAQRIKDQWGVSLEGDLRVDLSVGESIEVTPCPFGYLATYESQERLTGDREDRLYADRIDNENWERMQKALAVIRPRR